MARGESGAEHEVGLTLDWGGLRPWSRARATLAVATTLALLAGLFRSGVAVWRWAFTERISFLTRDIVWMAPLGTLLLFSGPALALALLAALAPRFATMRSVLFTLGVPAALSVLVLFGQIHDAASLILAAGIAWQLADRGARAPARTARYAGRGAVVLAALVGAIAIGLRGGPRLMELRREARLPSPARAAPNVLLIVLDAVRAANLSVYGYARPTTPGLQRWAQDGTVFEWGIAPSSWTLPSHGSMFTGRFPGALSAGFRRRIDATYPTLAEVLQSHGYVTGGFAANPNYTTRESGLARGFVHYDASHASLREIMLSATLMQSRAARQLRSDTGFRDAVLAIARPRFYMLPNLEHDPSPGELAVHRFLRWQERVAGRPFFAFLNLFDAHAPYRPPPQWCTRFSAHPRPVDRYDGAIAYEDAQIDTLLHTLARRSLLDRTIVIVTADHGELFGEHGLYYHNNGLHINVLRVPLLMRYPSRVPRGRRIAEPVGLRRLAASVLDLAGLPDTLLPGPSLSRAWTGRDSDTAVVRAQMQTAEDVAPFVPAGRGPMRGVIDSHWHYILEGDGHELLYAYRIDTLERTNLARTPQGALALPRLRSLAAALPPQP